MRTAAACDVIDVTKQKKTSKQWLVSPTETFCAWLLWPYTMTAGKRSCLKFKVYNWSSIYERNSFATGNKITSRTNNNNKANIHVFVFSSSGCQDWKVPGLLHFPIRRLKVPFTPLSCLYKYVSLSIHKKQCLSLLILLLLSYGKWILECLLLINKILT